MKILSDAPGMREFTVNEGRVLKRDQDGAFNVSQGLGKAMLKTGEWTQAGVTLRSAPGYRCADCNHLGVFKDKCRCGGTDLTRED